jgi:hypothetical protein
VLRTPQTALALPSSHRPSQLPGLVQPARLDLRRVLGERNVDGCLDVEARRVHDGPDRADRPGRLRGKPIKGKGRQRGGDDGRLLALVARPRKAQLIEHVVLKDRNDPVEEDLERPGHIAPVGRRADNEGGAFLDQLADALRIVPRKDALLVGSAFQAADARLDGKALDVDPYHFGSGAARLFRHDLEERCRDTGLPGAGIEYEDHLFHPIALV